MFITPPEQRPALTRPASAKNRLSQIRGVIWTVGSLIAVTTIKLVAFDYIGPSTPFLLYFASIILGAWYGGWRGGMLTTGASALLGALLFIPPFMSPHLASAAAAVRVAVFLLEGVAITAITARLRDEGTRADAAAVDARASLARLRAVLAGVADGITVQNVRGELIYANDAAARLTGFASAESLMAAPLQEVMDRFALFEPEGDPFPAAQLPGRLALQGLPAPDRLIRFRVRATGEERWANVRATAVKIEGDEVPAAVNVFHDVTDARRHEEALRVSQEWLSTTLQSIGDAVVATDAQGQVTFMNPVAELLTGWSSREAHGRPLAEVFKIVSESSRAPVASPVDLVLNGGQVVGLANHTILLRRDGVEMAIDDSAAPIRSPKGDLVGVVLVFRDVSQRRAEDQRRAFLSRASAELASSLDYKSTLAAVARLAVPAIADWCAVDIEEGGKLSRVAVEHIDPDRVRLVFEIERRYPDDPGSGGGVYQVLRTGKPVFLSRIPDEALAASAKDAEHLRLIRGLQLRSYIAVPLIASGTPIGVLTLAMAESGRQYGQPDLDLAVTLADRSSQAINHARLFTEATEARRTAEQANRSKDEFLAMLGHELRNPLAPIMTALHLMKMRAPDVLQRERSIMERQAKYLITMVDDLMDVSRITRGKIEIAKERVEVAEVLARSLELAAPLIDERRHHVVTSAEQRLLVEGDQGRLAQVFANLLTNAAKYTDPGGRIELTATRQGKQVLVTVKDNGVGIAPELLPRVFDLFVQGNQSLDRGKGGLGLGLAIVRSMVRLHGGEVSAHSDGDGRGSEFRVVLPAWEGADRLVMPVSPVAEASQPVKVRVLAVDDNNDALELLGEALRMFGCETHLVLDPLKAIAWAEAIKPDVALLDIGLPNMNGYELAGRLRGIVGLEHLKLVAITGYGQEADREKARVAGFDAFLVKPISINQVQTVLRTLISPATIPPAAPPSTTPPSTEVAS